MDINSINQQTSSAFQKNSNKGVSTLGQDQFLQLLIAQMRNQDPTNPLEGSEFASQLAQFNSVEQLISVNDGLKILQDSQNLMSSSLSNSMAANLTGKHIRALSNQISIGPSGGSEINFKLQSSAEEVEVIIRNESGNVVRKETLKGLASGDNSWTWDGKNDSGERMGEGKYQVEIAASNGDNNVESLVFIEGIAEKVRFTANGVLLKVNNVEIPIGDVEEVGSDKTEEK